LRAEVRGAESRREGLIWGALAVGRRENVLHLARGEGRFACEDRKKKKKPKRTAGQEGISRGHRAGCPGEEDRERLLGSGFQRGRREGNSEQAEKAGDSK